MQENILEYYKAQMRTISELDKFDARFSLLSSLDVDVKAEGYTDEQLDTHKYTLKLSESWFLFETLLSLINNFDYNKKRKPFKKNQHLLKI